MKLRPSGTAEVFWEVESLRAHATDVEGAKTVLVRESGSRCVRHVLEILEVLGMSSPFIGEVHLKASSIGT